MRVLLKFEIDCDADAAWRALHSPAAVGELYGPLLQMDSLATEGFPTAFQPGDDIAVGLSFAGVVPMGQQLIHVSDTLTSDSRGPVRIFRDSGLPLKGPLSTLDVWDHQMAVSPVPGSPERTLWRERLTIGGVTAPVLWPMLWTMWQWRASRIKALAPSWAYDPPAHEDDAA